jgi:hypothetical protein
MKSRNPALKVADNKSWIATKAKSGNRDNTRRWGNLTLADQPVDVIE